MRTKPTRLTSLLHSLALIRIGFYYFYNVLFLWIAATASKQLALN
jgi:succinate dehydrogenase/fumarate reductase cytochrome b subunit